MFGAITDLAVVDNDNETKMFLSLGYEIAYRWKQYRILFCR
jgi:hypothetical protein